MNSTVAATALVQSSPNDADQVLRQIREGLKAGMSPARLIAETSQALDENLCSRSGLRDVGESALAAASTDHGRLLDLLVQAKRRYDEERELWLVIEPLTRAD